MSDVVTVLGGTGFVGRVVADRWTRQSSRPLRYLVHRTRPDWLQDANVEVRMVDFGERRSVCDGLDGSSHVINLLRPDGSMWLMQTMLELTPLLTEVGVKRLVHTSSIDVFGAARAPLMTEQVSPQPYTPYQREHRDIETIVRAAGGLEVCIVRPGAIFGAGGRNLLAFADGSHLKSIVRRALHGPRRMHLVSVENVADAICLFASQDRRPPECVLVTDDEAPENNFAYVQDSIAAAFGRRGIAQIPALPVFVLKAMLAISRTGSVDPGQRFSNDRLCATGFSPERSFSDRLFSYAEFLAHRERL